MANFTLAASGEYKHTTGVVNGVRGRIDLTFHKGRGIVACLMPEEVDGDRVLIPLSRIQSVLLLPLPRKNDKTLRLVATYLDQAVVEAALAFRDGNAADAKTMLHEALARAVGPVAVAK